MNLLDPEERRQLLPAETYAYRSPIPTQSVSSDEFMPSPQTRDQQRVEARIKGLGGELSRRQGMSRRRFLATASWMAAAFLAMNEVYGPLYDVSRAEAQTPDMAKERAKELSKQFVMDCHTHFLRDDTRIMTFVRQREAVGKAGWNPALAGKPQTIDDLKFANYFKEVFLDSDTKVAMISGAPSDIAQDWFLTNEMKAEARARVNKEAGSRRMLAHAIFTSGARSIERNVASASTAACSGTAERRSSRKRLPAVAAAVAGFGARAGWTCAAAFPPASPR